MKNKWLRLAIPLVSVLTALMLVATSCQKTQVQPKQQELLFVQVMEENSAAKQVQAGDLDIYFWRIPPELADTLASDPSVRVIKSPGGTQSILLNPAPSENFNPFTLNEVRYAINFLIDRDFAVNDILKGYGLPMEAVYGPFDPDYLSNLDTINSFNIKYNPDLAQNLINEALIRAGAKKKDNIWNYGGKPIVVKFFIRTDDPKRKAVGELLAQELEKIGFAVERIGGDLNKAYNVIYGSDPKEGGWHLYTEGWGRSAFSKYDTSTIAQMYAPWYGMMPGQGEPSYWNYKNPELDKITKRIVMGEFSSKEERDKLLNQALTLGVSESVRIFVVNQIDPYLVNNALQGVVNDFGAGATGKFTITNITKTGGDANQIKIGMKQIFQGAWNPIGGFGDWYSTRIQQAFSDPALWTNPHTGDYLPFRADWKVETAGPNGQIPVPKEAILWDPYENKWNSAVEYGKERAGVWVEKVKELEKGGIQKELDLAKEKLKTFQNFGKVKSKVVYDLKYSNWHYGLPMTKADILFGEYFTREWGTNEGPDDRTVDPEYTNRVEPILGTYRGFRFLDDDTVEVYIDYWHFDQGYIADYGAVWAATPWELMMAMEKVVLDNQAAFSRSSSKAKNLEWLSLITPNHAEAVKKQLGEFIEKEVVPDALKGIVSVENAQARYQALITWIGTNNHAIVGNGPYFLNRVDSKARTVSLKPFSDPTYPFKPGHWSKFNVVNIAEIKKVVAPDVIYRGKPVKIEITVNVGGKPSSLADVNYWISDAKGRTVLKGGVTAWQLGLYEISLTKEQISKLLPGTYALKVFAVSPEAVSPAISQIRFLVQQEK